MSMDSSRRRSHRTTSEHRADALADILSRVLRSYALTVLLHEGCESCAVDVDIYMNQARELGVGETP